MLQIFFLYQATTRFSRSIIFIVLKSLSASVFHHCGCLFLILSSRSTLCNLGLVLLWYGEALSIVCRIWDKQNGRRTRTLGSINSLSQVAFLWWLIEGHLWTRACHASSHWEATHPMFLLLPEFAKNAHRVALFRGFLFFFISWVCGINLLARALLGKLWSGWRFRIIDRIHLGPCRCALLRFVIHDCSVGFTPSTPYKLVNPAFFIFTFASLI